MRKEEVALAGHNFTEDDRLLPTPHVNSCCFLVARHPVGRNLHRLAGPVVTARLFLAGRLDIRRYDGCSLSCSGGPCKAKCRRAKGPSCTHRDRLCYSRPTACKTQEPFVGSRSSPLAAIRSSGPHSSLRVTWMTTQGQDVHPSREGRPHFPQGPSPSQPCTTRRAF